VIELAVRGGQGRAAAAMRFVREEIAKLGYAVTDRPPRPGSPNP
jgi:hypothetical protein